MLKDPAILILDSGTLVTSAHLTWFPAETRRSHEDMDIKQNGEEYDGSGEWRPNLGSSNDVHLFNYDNSFYAKYSR